MTEVKPHLELLDLHGNYWNGIDEDGNVVPVGREDIGNYDTSGSNPYVESEPQDPISRRLGIEAIRNVIYCECGRGLERGDVCAHLGVSKAGKIHQAGTWGYDHIGRKPKKKNR